MGWACNAENDTLTTNDLTRLFATLERIEFLLATLVSAQVRAEKRADEMEQAFQHKQQEQMKSLLLAMGGATEWKS